MNRNRFNLIFTLSEKQPWLIDMASSLEYLLFDECKNEDEQDLIITLLSNFLYLSESDFGRDVRAIQKNIALELGLKPSETVISTLSADDKPDSGQYLLYPYKVYLEKVGWVDHRLVTKFGRIFREIKDEHQYTNIVLIDEFIGTGSTVVTRIKEIIRVFEAAPTSNRKLKFYMRAIAGMEKGLDYIKRELPDLDLYVLHILEEGISQAYSCEKEAALKRDLMISMELSNLSEKYKGIEMPQLGYGASEALYCREEGNTPNNVYPIFWWAYNRIDEKRPVVLYRSMEDA